MSIILSGAYTSEQSITNTTPVYLTSGGSVSVTSVFENGFDFNNGASVGFLSVSGLVAAEGTAISTDGNDRVYVTQTGIVSSTVSNGYAGITAGGGNNTITVAGYVYGSGFGITSSGESEVVISSTGIVQGGQSPVVANTDYSAAIGLIAGLVASTNTIRNAGQILGEENSDTGSRIGVIDAGFLPSVPAGYDVTSINFLNFYNTGYVLGDVIFAAGGDLYDGRGGGFVDGLIDMGLDNDRFFGGDLADSALGGGGNDTMSGGEGDDTLLGDDGADVIVGGLGDDMIEGGNDNDIVRAGGGNDNINGGLGQDTLRGGEGDDIVMGGDNDDLMFGNSGDDTLNGDAGVDVIRGGSGEDDITGGDARDVILGGLGADTFIYTATNDSGLGAAGDRIRDFTSGEDQLDLSAVASGGSFVGGGAFVGGGSASARLTVALNGSGVVRVDTDGDGVQDMNIVLIGTAALTEDDFIF